MVRKEDKASSSDADKLKKNKRTSVAVMVLTPLLVLALCLSIMTLVSYKKFIELQGYAAIAFNENAHLKNPSEDNKYRNADVLPMKGLTKVTVPDSENKTEQHEIIYPYYGDKYAELTVKNDKAGIDKEPVYWGDSDDLLAKGVVQSENFAAYYDKNNAELAHFDGYSSCTNFSNGYAFLNGSTVINSNFEIIGNAEYFVSGEGSTFYSELWSSTYSDTHVYDGGYFIGSNDFETDLTQKYKVIKIAPELYEEKSQ